MCEKGHEIGRCKEDVCSYGEELCVCGADVGSLFSVRRITSTVD